jgi:hypothetical protein
VPRICAVLYFDNNNNNNLHVPTCYNAAAASSGGLGGKARSLHHPLYLETVSRMKKRSRSSHQDLSTLKPCVSIADAVSLPRPAAVPIITACHCLSLSLFRLPPVDALAHKRNHPILLLPNASRSNLQSTVPPPMG